MHRVKEEDDRCPGLFSHWLSGGVVGVGLEELTIVQAASFVRGLGP